MFIAAFVFLGLAAVATVAWFCIPRKKSAEACEPCATQEEKQEKKLPWDPNASWQDIKTAWLTDCLSRDGNETPHHTAARSWGRTFALCAALCLIGVVLETQYNRRISISGIMNSFCQHRPASAQSHAAQFRPH